MLLTYRNISGEDPLNREGIVQISSQIDGRIGFFTSQFFVYALPNLDSLMPNFDNFLELFINFIFLQLNHIM